MKRTYKTSASITGEFPLLNRLFNKYKYKYKYIFPRKIFVDLCILQYTLQNCAKYNERIGIYK